MFTGPQVLNSTDLIYLIQLQYALILQTYFSNITAPKAAIPLKLLELTRPPSIYKTANMYPTYPTYSGIPPYTNITPL